MSLSSAPTLLQRPVFVQRILAFAVTRTTQSSNTDDYEVNNNPFRTAADKKSMNEPCRLLRLFKFMLVCKDWKETILHYSAGSCLTAVLPKNRFQFQEKFFEVAHRLNRIRQMQVQEKLEEELHLAKSNNSVRWKSPYSRFDLNHDEFFFQIIHLMTLQYLMKAFSCGSKLYGSIHKGLQLR